MPKLDRARWPMPLLGVLLVAALVFGFQLGRWPLVEPDEGRNAEVARELLTRGDWIVPHFNGLPFLDKPIALFWLIAAAFGMVGTTEFAARLPSAASGLVVVAATYGIARLLTDTRRAVIAATAVASAPLVLVFARLSIFDMPFTAAVTVAIWCLLRARLIGPDVVWVPLAGLAIGCACLTKGPVGIAVPLLAWGAASGAVARPHGPVSWRACALGFGATAVLVTPWLAAVAWREPGFLRYAFIDETFLRFTSEGRFHRGGAVYVPLVTAVGGFGVWAFALAAALPDMWRARRAPTIDAIAVRFGLRAAGAILLLFALSASKRPGYVLPAMVPLGVVIAIAMTASPQRAARAVRGVAILALVAVAGLWGSIRLGIGWGAGVWSAEAAPAFSRDAMSVGSGFAVCWAIVTVCATTIRRHTMRTVGVTALFAPGLVLVLVGPLTGYAEHRSARALAAHIAPESTVVALRTFRTSLPFYLQRPVVLATSSGRELTSNYVAAQAPRFFADASLVRPFDMWDRLDPERPVAVVASPPLADAIERANRRGLHRVAADHRSVVLAASRPTLVQLEVGPAPAGGSGR